MKDFVGFVSTMRGGKAVEKSKPIFAKFPSIKVSFMVRGWFENGDAGTDTAIVVGSYENIEDFVALIKAFPKATRDDVPQFSVANSDFLENWFVLEDGEAKFTEHQINKMKSLQLNDPEYKLVYEHQSDIERGMDLEKIKARAAKIARQRKKKNDFWCDFDI